VLRDVDLGDPAVSGLDGGDAGQGQLLGQAVLQRGEGALGAAPGLGRIGGDMLDAELGQSPADLGQRGPGDLAAGLGREE
jgi:hypothetical protein